MTSTVLKKFTIIGAALTILSGCSSLNSSGGFSASSDNFARGSAVSASLSSADRKALGAAVVQAMETGQPQQWTGGRAAGVVMADGYSLANLKSDPAKRLALAHPSIELDHAMETELGLYVLTRNSNIRRGPGTDKAKIETLPSGAGVEVVGGVIGKNWMLVAHDDRVVGYIYRDLLVKAPGTELDLAGGPRRQPILCREFTQRINVYSQRDEWTGAACQTGSGWRLADEPGPDLLQDDETLLGL